LLQSLMDNIPDSIYFKDRRSRFTKVNRPMLRKYGLDHSSLVGKSDSDLFSREHAQAAFDDEQAIINSGKPLIGKVEKETFRDGRINWVTTTKLPLRNAAGTIIGTMGISRDITDLKTTQEALSKERSLMRTVLDNMPDRIFAKDREGRYIASNQRHYRFLGADDKESVLGKTVFDFFPKETAERLHNEDLHIARSGIGLINNEERVKAQDGSTLWFLTSKVPLINEDGEIIGIVGIARDVTDEKKNEEQLKRTIEVLNETRLQLIESEKLKTVGRLAAGVAHEVKNPIGVVRMGVEYLKDELKDHDEFSGVLEDMLQATDKANEVIMELLDYSSPQEVDMQPTDVNDLIRRVNGLLKHNFNQSKIRVTEALDESPCEVLLNVQKLEQAFINLCLNAIAAMPDGGELRIRTRRERMRTTGGNVSGEMTERFKVGARLVVIEFEDSGHGIQPSHKDKLFEPFFSTRTTGEGTGLGLSVTRSIIEMHRGLITLDNRRDHPGACARVILPEHTPEST
ncbi:MAG: PAS domain-containing protein, partial [Verrucomicrobiota bacterium]